MLVFPNVLPLGLTELKNAADQDAAIWSHYAQLSHQRSVALRLDRPLRCEHDEAAFAPADGCPADATLTSQGGRCSNPSLPGVPANVPFVIGTYDHSPAR
jgi:hypothetical protein